MSAKKGSETNIVVGSGAKKNRVGPKARLAILIATVVVVLGALAGGGYLVWHSNQKSQEQKAGKLPFRAPDADNKQYTDSIKNLKGTTTEDQSSVLSVQMAVFFSQKDYDATIGYAKQLLALPGHENDINALQFMARSYAEQGKKDEAKQTNQKIVAYYDAHPDEKAAPLGANLYKAAQERLKQ